MESERKQEQGIQQRLESLGYTVLERIKGSHEHDVFVAEVNGEKKVLKTSTTPEKKRHIQNQVEAEAFLSSRLTGQEGVFIPEGSYVEEGDLGIGVFGFVDGQPVSTLDNKVETPLTDEEVGNLIDVYTRFREVPLEDLPERMQREGVEFFTDDNWRKKLQAHLDQIPETIVSANEREKIFQNLDEIGYHSSLQHHDIIPWNILRTSDDQLAITDAEYARWGARHYDIAYYYIQNIVYLDQEEHAKQYLQRVVQEMGARFPDDDVKKEIMYPMTYRVIVNVNEAQGKSEREQQAARSLLDKILQNDFDVLV